MDPLTLDDLDRRLVHALQLDGRVSFARQVSRSAPAPGGTGTGLPTMAR